MFARGWHRVKLYFMIGLPTEDDDDVRGICNVYPSTAPPKACFSTLHGGCSTPAEPRRGAVLVTLGLLAAAWTIGARRRRRSRS